MTSPNRITLHWSAGLYTPNFLEESDYHLLVIPNPALRSCSLMKCANFDAFRAHTWHQNTGNIGIAFCGMAGANENNFGKYPLLSWMTSSVLLAAAMIAEIKGINTTNIRTHAEYAIQDGYWGERWDFAITAPRPGMCKADAVITAAWIRSTISKIRTGGASGSAYPIDFMNEIKRRI